MLTKVKKKIVNLNFFHINLLLPKNVRFIRDFLRPLHPKIHIL